MRTLTIRALTWLQSRRAQADDRGAVTAEYLMLTAVGVAVLAVLVQPRMNDIVTSVLDTIEEALPG